MKNPPPDFPRIVAAEGTLQSEGAGLCLSGIGGGGGNESNSTVPASQLET